VAAALLVLAALAALQPSTVLPAHADDGATAKLDRTAIGRSGPMDAQPAQSPVANTTNPPGALTGSGSPAPPGWQGWITAVVAAVVLVLLAVAVGLVGRHRRLPRPDPEDATKVPH
jgi:hypothetical protein